MKAESLDLTTLRSGELSDKNTFNNKMLVYTHLRLLWRNMLNSENNSEKCGIHISPQNLQMVTTTGR